MLVMEVMVGMGEMQLNINKATGRVQEVVYLRSLNCDKRPKNQVIDLLVIHNISLPLGCFEGEDVIDLFLNKLDNSKNPAYQSLVNVRVSAHCFIRRDGTLIQFVPFHRRAWHAGESTYEGRPHCNNFSIGIELEGSDHTPFESLQYERLSELTRALIAVYPTLSIERIVGHSDIAPQRKTDPGPFFDWVFFKQQLRKL